MDSTQRTLLKLSIWGVILLTLYILRKVVFRNAARKILENTEQTYAPRHEWREANVSDFPDLDQEFYKGMTAWLESLGYRHMGDAENMTLSRINPTMKHCLRYMVSPDGTMNAAIYHVVAPGHSLKIFDIMSEYSNGDFVETSNATEAAKLDTPPQIHHLFFPPDTPYDQILDAHAKAMADFQAQHPGVTSVVLASKADIRASGDRQQAIKSAFRKQHGVVTGEEIKRIAKPGQQEMARGVAEEIEKMKRDKR